MVTRSPQIIPYSHHNISQQFISPNALKVLRKLETAGFNAYLVGGCIRDILLGRTPKDFDIATDARPEQLKRLFRNCLLIGRRFRLAHIRFGSEIIEVTTFRAADAKQVRKHRALTQRGMLLWDNVYGTIDEDVWRRDFTINALYYNSRDCTLLDYCNGLNDLAERRIRIIGNPQKRYQEDPVRLLRAIRFISKLDFQLAPDTKTALIQEAHLLEHVPSARLFEEVLKLFYSGKALVAYHLLKQYQLLQWLFPQIIPLTETTEQWLEAACRNTDLRILEGKTVTPAFLFATLLWQPLQKIAPKYLTEKTSWRTACLQATSLVLAKQHQRTTLPRFCSQFIRDIWILQADFEQRRPSRIERLLHHPRFRAAYDFLLLRAQCHEVSGELATWWTTLQASSLEQQTALIQQLIQRKIAPNLRKHVIKRQTNK